MKTLQKFLMIVYGVLVVGGFSRPAIAYNDYTPITDVNITSHQTGDIVFAEKSYTLTCTTSTDWDCDSQMHTINDTVTHTWSAAAGSFTSNVGTSVTWTAPTTPGDVNVTVTADDSPLYDDDPKTDTVTLNVSYEVFSILDGSGNNIAVFDNLGNLLLKGTISQNSAHTATAADEFRIQDSNSNDVGIIDANNGNLYIDGTLYENQGTLRPSSADDNFIIQDANGNVVAYIKDSGALYLKGKLYEQTLN